MKRYVTRLGLGRIVLLAGLMLALLACRPALVGATSFSWNVNTGGAFNDSANWVQKGLVDLDGIPDANDDVTFRRGSGVAYTVTFPGTGPFGTTPVNYVTDQLRVGNNTVTFVDTTSSLPPRAPIPSTYTLNNTATSESGRGMIVGVSAADTAAVLTTRLASLSATAATIGDAAGSIGTLNVSAGTFNVTGSSAGDIELIIGNNGTGTLDVSNGADVTLTQANADAWLGAGSNSTGTATVNGAGSSLSVGRSLGIGIVGTATFNVTGGGVVTDVNSALGEDIGSAGTTLVSGDGSKWTNSGELDVGLNGDGALTIAAGGQVKSLTGRIGQNTGLTAAATVDGAGSASTLSQWTVTGSLYVGASNATNTLDLRNGGQVSDNIGYIGYNSNSLGAVTVDGIDGASGKSSLWTNSFLYIGYDGTATLDIHNGGQVTNGTDYVGFNSGSHGAVTVSGANGLVPSKWLNNNGFYVGYSGTGTLDVTDGGQLQTSNGGYIGYNAGSTGAVTLSGTGSAWNSSTTIEVGYIGDGTLTVGTGAAVFAPSLIVGDLATGSLSVSGGTVQSGSDSILGNQAGSAAMVTLASGGHWDYSSAISNDFIIGNYGTGQIDIRSGSQMNTMGQSPVVLGKQSGSHGIVNIEGPMSQLFVELQRVEVGSFGNGEIHVTGGGAVAALNSFVFVAEQPGTSGEISLDGAGSKLDVFDVTIAVAGTATLDITAGAILTTDDITLAANMGSSATGVVDGVGSKLSAAAGDGELIVGGGDHGSLTVSGGALAEGKVVIIADAASGNGTVLVTGNGSKLSATDELYDGFSGVGKLTVSNGATVTAPLIRVNDLSSIHGNATLIGDVENHGVVAPGTSPGALHITGNYIQMATAQLQIELAGTTPGVDYDQLLISGNASLDGTLDVSLTGGFAPGAGNTFDILSFTGLTGKFATLDLPALAGGLSWNTSQLYITGELTVGGVLGDYNHDGIVDAADYTVWRDTLGSTTSLSADGNGNGMVDSGDYTVWKSNFGNHAGAGSSATAAVPEPAALWMLLAGILTLCCRRRPKLS